MCIRDRVSSLAYDDTIDEAARIGAAGFVYKPFDGEQLFAALSKMCIRDRCTYLEGADFCPAKKEEFL